MDKGRNKSQGRRLAMAYSLLPTNRQKEMAVIRAEAEIASFYRRVLRVPSQDKKSLILREIGAYVSFILLVKGEDYLKTCLYRVMINLNNDGLVWISWKNSGFPKPKTAYFFVRRHILIPVELRARQVSYWEGDVRTRGR